jgi:hypothetical protein
MASLHIPKGLSAPQNLDSLKIKGRLILQDRTTANRPDAHSEQDIVFSSIFRVHAARMPSRQGNGAGRKRIT